MSCLLAAFGLATGCCQQNYENTDPEGFEALIAKPDVVLLDVRTAEEFQEGHIDGALNIDMKKDDFMEKAKAALSKERTIAVYCRSGRRSASAAADLGSAGYKVVNLLGGITAWKLTRRPVATDTYEQDAFQTRSGKAVKFHALVHASIRIEYDGREIVVDPVAKLGDKTIDYASMPKADYLLVTHEHFDHFDREAIKTLSNGHTRFITNQRCVEMFGAGEVMKNGERLQISDDFTIEAVPAYNTTPGHLQFHPKGRDNGYVLTIDGLRIYVAGDTEDIPEMAAVKDIDIAFLPCNQPYTMTTDQLVRAAKMVKPRVLFPYHYGQTDVSGIPALLQAEGIDVRIRHYE